MYPHQETIAENKIDISKLPAKLQTKINKFNELEKKKYRTEEEEEEVAEKDEAIFNDIMDWLEEQGESEPKPEEQGEPEPKGESKPEPKGESKPEPKGESKPEPNFAEAPTATPKEAEPKVTKPKEKVFNPVLGFAE